MKMITLKKYNEPDTDKLQKMNCDLMDFLKEDVNPEDKEWMKNFKTILDFQDPDGSFKLYRTFKIPGDARVEFCFMPTYFCTAVLMKAYLTNPEIFSTKDENAFLNALEMTYKINFAGHGYGALKDQIDALNVFMNGGVREFMDLHSDFCPNFMALIENNIIQFKNMESQAEFLGGWGESYEKEIREINEYFSKRNVFVYGTLMTGEANHHYLEKSTCLGKRVIEGYKMYDVGWYPAIIKGNNLIVGELYEVSNSDMPSIDMLEGEGSLYAKKCEQVKDSNGNTTLAFVYVYLRDCSSLKKISVWNEEYVWYVSYGSNMLKERFMCYIKGGSYESSSYRKACDDTTEPLAVKTFDIPYEMYFGNTSGSWEYGGVSFLDTDKKGHALGVAYLITEKQLHHVAAEENGGTPPEKSNGWYTDIIDLGTMDGFKVKTLTNKDLRTLNDPCESYINTLYDGIKENWPDMSDKQIMDYINSYIR